MILLELSDWIQEILLYVSMGYPGIPKKIIILDVDMILILVTKTIHIHAHGYHTNTDVNFLSLLGFKKAELSFSKIFLEFKVNIWVEQL